MAIAIGAIKFYLTIYLYEYTRHSCKRGSLKLPLYYVSN